MEGPGMSLFQGAASIHINNSAQDRLDEQEEIEDQKRRNEELKHKLANAFDDLVDDDEASSVNSSGNFTLDAGQSNGVPQARSGKPPTYVESLNHLKEMHHAPESPKPYVETPKSHNPNMRHTEEPMKLQYSPYGAGDGQNNYYQQDFRGHINGMNNYEARQEYMNNEQLKVMYEMRVKECQQLASQREQLDTEVDSLRARLAASINDRDKAELSLQEAHHLLASSKHKLIELEQQVTKLTEKLMESEQDKEQLKMELRSANMSLQDVSQRLHTLQVSHTHNTDALFREQQDRHREEVDRLQNDFTKAKSRLDEKDNEIKTLERRCMEKEREKEEVLIEKGVTINRLAGELEAAQARLAGGESARLRDKLALLAAERNTAREQLKEMGSKLQMTAHELALCRNKLSSSQKEYEHWRSMLHQILAETIPDNTFLGEPPSPGKLTALKEVLSRYKLQIQKLTPLQEEIGKRDKKLEHHRKVESELRAQIEEQRGVEAQLQSRLAVLRSQLDAQNTHTDAQLIDTYKQQNDTLQQQLEKVRAELNSLDVKYTELEVEHERLKSEKGGRASLVAEANSELLRELDRCSKQLKDTLNDNGDLKTLYLQACSARDSVSRELKDLQTKLQKERELFKTQEKDFVERIERQRQHVDKLTADLSSSREELDRANKRISELQKDFNDKQKDFTEKLDKYLHDEKTAMRKEMEPCAQCEKHIKHMKYLDDQLSKCTIKLASQESNEALMKELKGKAEFFQQYIVERFHRLRDQRSVATNTDQSTNCNNSPSTKELALNDGDDTLEAKTAMMMKEKAIRDQIAEKFTLETKTVEMNCARKIKEIENEHLGAITKLKELLERKAHEVETLKEFILAERAKVSQVLEAKESEVSELIKEHNQIQIECQKNKDSAMEWKLKAEKYKERASRLGSLEDVLKSEREDWKQRTNSCAKECHNMKVKVAELQSRLLQYEQKFEAIQREHQAILDKYKNAKKTIFTYKDYVSKKDSHINNEMKRIQDEYRKIFVKLQTQLNQYVNCRVQDERRGKQSPSNPPPPPDYSDRIKKLNEDFAQLAQSTFKDVPFNNQ